MEIKLTDWQELHTSLFNIACVKQANGEVTALHESNTTFYAKVPQEIRRCFYLDGNAVNVLLELVSWGMLDKGRKRKVTEWFAIHQQVMSLHLGLSENTVSTKLKELHKKNFIEVQKRGRRNFYRVNTTLNPYVVLSEAIHAFLKHVYSKTNYETVWEQMEWEEKEKYKDKQDLFQEAVANVVLPTVKHKKFYQPYVAQLRADIRNAITESGMLYLAEYECIVEDLFRELSKKIERQFQKMVGDVS